MLLATKGLMPTTCTRTTGTIPSRGCIAGMRSAFDTSMLVPAYFVVMVILAFYGIHRYQLVWLYYRNKKNAAKWDEPGGSYAEGELPFVTIQLPIFNEQVRGRPPGLTRSGRLQYPRRPLRVQLLDDSTDETVAVAAGDLHGALRAGFRRGWTRSRSCTHQHRTNRYGYKAGARWTKGLKRYAHGELIAIFDADFCSPARLADEGRFTTLRSRASAWWRTTRWTHASEPQL